MPLLSSNLVRAVKETPSILLNSRFLIYYHTADGIGVASTKPASSHVSCLFHNENAYHIETHIFNLPRSLSDYQHNLLLIPIKGLKHTLVASQMSQDLFINFSNLTTNKLNKPKKIISLNGNINILIICNQQ